MKRFTHYRQPGADDRGWLAVIVTPVGVDERIDANQITVSLAVA